MTFDIVIQFEVAFFSEPSGSGCLVLPVLALIIEIFLPFRCSVDEGFPPVSFHFGKSLNLTVYPHDYLFPFVSILLILLNRHLSIYPFFPSLFLLSGDIRRLAQLLAHLSVFIESKFLAALSLLIVKWLQCV